MQLRFDESSRTSLTGLSTFLRNSMFIFTPMNPAGSILGRRHRFIAQGACVLEARRARNAAHFEVWGLGRNYSTSFALIWQLNMLTVEVPRKFSPFIFLFLPFLPLFSSFPFSSFFSFSPIFGFLKRVHQHRL